ncbi:MAG: cystathionine beta-synthase [Deltaproteobacteria bacterium]
MMHGAAGNVLDAVGNTPIVKLNRVVDDIKADIYVKLEYLNPAGSMKDRIAINIVNAAEREGRLKPGGTIVEATSGNTGAGLAMVAAVRGYKGIFVMPDKMSQEKIAALRAWGAKVVVCPTSVEPEDPRSYYSVSKRLSVETPNAILANQYHNQANPEAHYLSTGPEIWKQTNGEVDAFVSGMGTGGTLSGTGKYLKEQKPSLQIVGVDPVGSLYYDFAKNGQVTKAFSYKVEGIGEDFFPSTMNLKILDDVLRVDDRECFHMTRDLVRLEGLYVGGSSGAAVAGAIKYARQRDRKENILVLLPDGAGKYLSKIFNDDWMRENGFLDAEPTLGTVREMLAGRANKTVVTAKPQDTVRQVIATLKQHGISQLPVVEGERLRGIVAEVDVLRHLVTGEGHLDGTIAGIIESDYATVSLDTRVELLQAVLSDAKVALVTENEKLMGLVTKIDLIDFLARKATT